MVEEKFLQAINIDTGFVLDSETAEHEIRIPRVAALRSTTVIYNVNDRLMTASLPAFQFSDYELQ